MSQDTQIKSLLEALQLSPNNLPLKKYIAQLLVESGRLTEAIPHLQEILSQEHDTNCVELLAESYYQLGRFPEFHSLVNQLDVPLYTAKLYFLLSKVHFVEEKFQEAISNYDKAMDLDASLEDPSFSQKLKKHMLEKPKLRVVEFPGKQDESDQFEQPQINFQDIGGLEELKEQIRMNIIYPFQNPELFRSYGKKIGGGILLYGPPGCGKTHIARATAGECGAHFVSINIHDILDMYIGQSERNLHSIFETARAKSPTIVFIDELDAIGGSRQQSQSSFARSLTNQLLSELDGIHAKNQNILVLGATNTPWFVDSALRRPGRFDRILFVSPPDLQARLEILQIHLKDRPTEQIDYMQIAKQMKHYSGADIRSVCDLATESAIQVAMKTGQIRKIQTDDLIQALKKVKPSTLEWLATARNYATYSNESGIYDEILEYLKKN